MGCTFAFATIHSSAYAIELVPWNWLFSFSDFFCLLNICSIQHSNITTKRFSFRDSNSNRNVAYFQNMRWNNIIWSVNSFLFIYLFFIVASMFTTTNLFLVFCLLIFSCYVACTQHNNKHISPPVRKITLSRLLFYLQSIRPKMSSA